MTPIIRCCGAPVAVCGKAKECVRGGDLDQAISLFQQVLEVQETHAAAREGIAAVTPCRLSATTRRA